MNIQNTYSVYFYTTSSGRTIIMEFVLSLNPETRSKTWNGIQLLKKYGLKLMSEKYVKKVSTNPNLFELRAVGKTQVRMMFVQKDSNTFVIVHGFIKKTQKLPIKDKALAIKRAKEIL